MGWWVGNYKLKRKLRSSFNNYIVIHNVLQSESHLLKTQLEHMSRNVLRQVLNNYKNKIYCEILQIKRL